MLDRIIHERSRLHILTYLAGNDEKEVGFNELQDRLNLTSGNLSIQLKKLNEASYVKIKKIFRNNKPYTTVILTAKGRIALEEYIDEMDDLIHSLRKA